MQQAEFKRIVFQSELVTIGEFRCARQHPRFTDSGPIQQHCFVFPRSAVTIEHEHHRPFVANANVVTLYNRQQRYLRGALAPEGDRCDWFGLDGGLARDVVRRFDPTVDDRPDEPFRAPLTRSDAALYLLQRQVHELAASGRAEPWAIEELVVLLFERVLELVHGTAPRALPCAHAATLRAERLLSQRWSENLKLGELAQEVGLSVYHLCHTFRRETGTTLNHYRHQLRLRASMEPLRRTERPLVELALHLGFSSHSHFTSSFRRAFGLSPSQWRAQSGARPSSSRA